ncbi:uncharacterized protein [Aegilops tauschii subsp. strangulata]|nr:uncharacterized protein LOC109747150 [Aegilops tauschii subsp. strangulata]XP_045087893.1 uncharacterized protein LOC109747150 [Aegilops tauschii subsp. strangulata]
MALPTLPCNLDALPTVQATLPDHLTEEILLRVPTAADLARASMAGPSLRRIIADHSFLRRFCALHPPPLLGVISCSFIPSEPPHPSAAAARALTDSDFSCSFLPSREPPWCRCDFRDGRALFCVVPDDRVLVRDFAVCDPLHRRYLLLPPVPQDVSDLVYHCQPFLAPAGEDDGTGIAADASLRFRVMCLAKYQTQLVIFVFSSSGPHAGQWQTVAFDGWSTLVAGISEDARSTICFGKRYYVHRCFCWAIPGNGINKLLMLHIRTMEFSSINLPPGTRDCEVAFVEASEERLGMFTLHFSPEDYAYHLWYAILVGIGDDPRQWQTEDVVPLPHDYCYYTVGVAGGYLLLNGFPKNPDMRDPDCFSLNLQTMKLEHFCGASYVMPLQSELYVGFPPSLSPPTI